ncbi:MAG: hypothetical protein AB7L13_17015 [Acidimicrobiia bacterium]
MTDRELQQDSPIEGVPTDNTTLVVVLAGYAEAGFDVDFLARDDGRVACGRCGHEADATTFELHSLRRLEGASDPADMAAVLALTCPACDAHGTLIVRFGPEATAEEAQLLELVRDRRESDTLPFGAAPNETGEADDRPSNG